MAKRNVFISYRRDDAAGFSHAIHDRLVEHLSREQVFMDVRDIAAGSDFVKTLEGTVDRCTVLLALIGKRWAGDGGKSRLDEPQDWVRAEIAQALNRGVKVIPVLLDGATMPAAESLPQELRPLTRMNAMEVRTSRLDADVWDLTGTVVQALGGKWPPDEPGGAIYAIMAGLYALFAGGVAVFVMLASMFMSTVPMASILAVAIFALNAALLLRLPIHHWVRTLSRQKALKIAAAIHLVGFLVMAVGSSETEGGFVFLFAIVPAAALFLGSFAMRRAARS